MNKNIRMLFLRIITALVLAPVVTGFSALNLSSAMIPQWTQQPKFSCFPSDQPIAPIPAFVGGLVRERKGRTR